MLVDRGWDMYGAGMNDNAWAAIVNSGGIDINRPFIPTDMMNEELGYTLDQQTHRGYLLKIEKKKFFGLLSKIEGAVFIEVRKDRRSAGGYYTEVLRIVGEKEDREKAKKIIEEKMRGNLTKLIMAGEE